MNTLLVAIFTVLLSFVVVMLKHWRIQTRELQCIAVPLGTFRKLDDSVL